MLSPAKAIVAGAVAFALAGVVFIAQPFDRDGTGVPGAATDDPAMAPSFFKGTFGDDWNMNAEPVGVRRGDGAIAGTGESYTVSWEANDPRISGTGTIVMNETDYRGNARSLAPTGDTGSVRTGLLRIVNDAGSWSGPYTELVLSSSELGNMAGWLAGTGAYDGLSAYVVVVDWGAGFSGHITAEGPPPVPELPAE